MIYMIVIYLMSETLSWNVHCAEMDGITGHYQRGGYPVFGGSLSLRVKEHSE